MAKVQNLFVYCLDIKKVEELLLVMEHDASP